MPQLLPNPDFLNWFLAAINSASKSVTIVNYLATYDTEREGDSVGRIVTALAAAIKRNVKVEIILEGSKFRENFPFYQVLKNAGASVWMDTSLTFIHTKAILIDDNTLCIGSHNLSQNALTRHEEMSLTTNDASALTRFRQELKKMTRQRDEIMNSKSKDGVALPASIIEGANSPLIKIKRSIAPNAYLVYLYIWHLSGGTTKPVIVDAKKWVDELGFKDSTASDSTRIDSSLDHLAQKLKVINYDAGKHTVSLIIPLLCKPALECCNRGEGIGEVDPHPSIFLPSTFWQYDWHKTLSVEAIHMYLAGEAQKLTSPFAPWWRLKRDEIAARYGFQKQMVNRAQTELKRYCLLEIMYETGQGTPQGRYTRYMNYFRQNPFYDRLAALKKIEELQTDFSAEIFIAAKRLLAYVGDDMDATKLESTCEIVEKTDKEKVAAITRVLASLAPNSTKRTFSYIKELFEE